MDRPGPWEHVAAVGLLACACAALALAVTAEAALLAVGWWTWPGAKKGRGGMSGLIEDLLAAAATELGRQRGPHLDLDGDRGWIIDGVVDMTALVGAVAREVLAALREPSEAVVRAVYDVEFDYPVADYNSMISLYSPRQVTAILTAAADALAREHGLEASDGE